VEWPYPLESKEHELQNLGSEEEVEELLQEGPSSGVRFLKVPENLVNKDVELSFSIKMLEFMDFLNQELKQGKQERLAMIS
jgi:hypothetical protein